MKTSALIVAGLIFLIVAVTHFWRYSKATMVMMGDQTVPVEWSLYGGIVSILLALWMFISASKK